MNVTKVKWQNFYFHKQVGGISYQYAQSMQQNLKF